MGKASDYRVTVRVIGEPSKEALFRVYANLRRCHAEQMNVPPVGPISFAETDDEDSPTRENGS